MTREQYRRLVKVSILPLLVAGVIFSFAMKPPSSIHIICEYVDNCWIANEEGWFSYDTVKDRRGPLFDVEVRDFKLNKYPYAAVSATGVLIPNASIVGVSSYLGTSEAPGSPFDQLKGMDSKKIVLDMGSEDLEGEVRLLNPLGCNELNLAQSPNVFEAGLCGVPDGVVRVRFVTDKQTTTALQKLKETIEQETEKGRQRLIEHFAILIPSPIILFFLLSGFVWLLRRAASYVIKGSKA